MKKTDVKKIDGRVIPLDGLRAGKSSSVGRED